jgi:glutamyl-tRNA synthetase
VGDVVLRRADGLVAYHLATAVDELSLGISAVVRGHDLWPAPAAQVAVMAALGYPAPTYWHGPLLLDGSGQRLAKRSGAEGLEALREQGLDSPAVVGLLAAGLDLVARGSRLSAADLLAELKRRQQVREPDLKLQELKTGDGKLAGASREKLSLELPLRRLVAAQMEATLPQHQT